MDFIARKISRPKWERFPIRADAITGCLRTRGDTLSFWKCNENDVSEVVLALASNMDCLATFDIVLLLESELRKDGFFLQETPGQIPIKDSRLMERHVDVMDLELDSLGLLSRVIHTQVTTEAKCFRFNKTKVRDILCQAVIDGRLYLSDLEERQSSLKDAIHRNLDKI